MGQPTFRTKETVWGCTLAMREKPFCVKQSVKLFFSEKLGVPVKLQITQAKLGADAGSFGKPLTT